MVTAAAEEKIEHVDFESVVHGHHVYKEIWTPGIGEELALRVEYRNEHDTNAVAVVKAGIIVGHVQVEHSQLFWSFITRGGCITCSITGRRRKGNGLEVPCSYQFLAKRKLLKQVKKHLQ